MENGSDGLGTVRYFFSKAKKYSTIVNSNKHELENKTPIDFVDYILENCKNYEGVEKDNQLKNSFYSSDEFLFTDLCFSSTKREKAFSYARYFHNLEKNLNLPTDVLERYYFCQETALKVLAIGEEMEQFLKENRISDHKKFTKKYEKTTVFLTELFQKVMKEKIEKKEEKEEGKIEYTEETFLFKEKIDKILKEKVDQSSDFKKDLYEIVVLNKKSPWNYPYPIENFSGINLRKTDLTTIRFISSKTE